MKPHIECSIRQISDPTSSYDAVNISGTLIADPPFCFPAPRQKSVFVGRRACVAKHLKTDGPFLGESALRIFVGCHVESPAPLLVEEPNDTRNMHLLAFSSLTLALAKNDAAGRAGVIMPDRSASVSASDTNETNAKSGKTCCTDTPSAFKKNSFYIECLPEWT